MAYSEKTVLSCVSVLPESNTIDVRWTNQVLRDAEVISETYIRRSFSAFEKPALIAEVENGVSYASALGW
jgi:hypothetical protein